MLNESYYWIDRWELKEHSICYSLVFFTIYQCSCEYHTLSEKAHQAFQQGVVEGRQGKGIIYGALDV
jgi:hypothetical protein